jgi:hypothetical protein
MKRRTTPCAKKRTRTHVKRAIVMRTKKTIIAHEEKNSITHVKRKVTPCKEESSTVQRGKQHHVKKRATIGE